MKVKEMVELLQQFNTNADIVYNNNGITEILELYGWSCNNVSDVEERNIQSEKQRADTISFISKNKIDDKTYEE